ncbi:hypothetical protein TNCV_4778271 [Trichonephila clavipes]|nr:hypothetical protein TNCV_4778271 [Trichonephila clavipes]
MIVVQVHRSMQNYAKPLKNFDEDIRLSQSDGEDEERTNPNDNISVNPGVYVSRDGTEWIQHNGNVPGRFTIGNGFVTKQWTNILREA